MKTNISVQLRKDVKAAMSRIVTEIILDGWEKTGFTGKSVTSKKERKGLKRFAKRIRKMNLDSGLAAHRLLGEA